MPWKIIRFWKAGEIRLWLSVMENKNEQKQYSKTGDCRQPLRLYRFADLKDAGCTDEMVEKFMALQDSEDEEQQIRLLSGYRKHLLEKLHREEKRIDCLDYLLYQMQNKK